jgi:hypothetical protein
MAEVNKLRRLAREARVLAGKLGSNEPERSAPAEAAKK